MGKRSNFERVGKDFYPTPFKAVGPLIPHLKRLFIESFYEPCAGDGRLVRHFEHFGLSCTGMCDIDPQGPEIVEKDILELGREDFNDCDAILTNPPWTRDILHAIIRKNIVEWRKPMWLLFDADWAHTKQASELIVYCSDIVPVGRQKWIEGSSNTGKDNACWHFFPGYYPLRTVFHPR